MKTNRELLVDALIDLSFDELEKEDYISLAKASEKELIERLIYVANFFKYEYNS